jgi:hypothetical protein
MQDSPDTLEAAAEAAAPSAPADETWGWYLYGITRNTEQPTVQADDTLRALPELESEEHTAAIPGGDLMAVVRRVPLAEFTPEALRAQADSSAWLEAMARRHHEVINIVHRTRAILPAKFGSVYAHAEDVRTALIEERDTLLVRLNWIDDCDEWGVRLYGDLATIRQRADEEQESVQRLRKDLASASPGRAYFLQRKLADERAGAIDRFLDGLAHQAYEHCAHHAKAGQVSMQLSGTRVNQDQQQVELLRAAFLVARHSTEAFIADVHRFTESQAGIQCEYSGPWPPYSFAAHVEEV